jgi:hypothetical protein
MSPSGCEPPLPGRVKRPDPFWAVEVQFPERKRLRTLTKYPAISLGKDPVQQEPVVAHLVQQFDVRRIGS